MWNCHKCGKPVYFAERKQSLGYDWHPECLRCEECGKRLNPGQHAEHKGVPYCHVPCYGALFGPQLFGHGTTVESHKSFGQPNPTKEQSGAGAAAGGPATAHNHKCQSMLPPRDVLDAKLKTYNQYHDNKSMEVRSREVNGRLVLEGTLRVYWGVQGVIHLKEDDDQRTVITIRKRNSCRYSTVSTTDATGIEEQPLLARDPMTMSMTSENGVEGVSQSDSTTCDSCTWSEDNGQGQVNGTTNHSPNSDEDAGGSTSLEVSPLHNHNHSGSTTLPSKLVDVKQISSASDWDDEVDDLLQVERKVDDGEKVYQTMPSPLKTSSSISEDFVTADCGSSEKTLTKLDYSPDSLNTKNESETTLLNSDETESEYATLKPEDFDDFKRRVQREFLDNSNQLRTSNDGTLKANQPIDPSRINDSLKLYGEQNPMAKSFNGVLGQTQSYEIDFENALKQYETMHNVISLENDGQIKNSRRMRPSRINGMMLQKSESSSTCSAASMEKSSSSSSDTLVANTSTGSGLSKSKSGPNCFHRYPNRNNGTRPTDDVDSNDDDDLDDRDDDDDDDATLRPPTTTIKRNMSYEPKSISIRMDCYDELEPSLTTSVSATTSMATTATTDTNNTSCETEEDGVVLRKPPKTGSTAIKRRSGNRRSRTKLKRRCSINGHFYNRETSFFTPPHGSMMSVWVSSLVDTKEIINLLLEKYKVDSRAENFALFIVRDNGEQSRVKTEDYPLIVRVLLGPHEDVARLFLVDGNFTPEISSEVAQYINLSEHECRSILDRYGAEKQREEEKIKERYAELKRRIVQRMESLKVRL